MMPSATLDMDIHEAVQFIELYHLNALIWTPKQCPLKELENYQWRGDEEYVIVAGSNNMDLPFRMVYFPDPNPFEDDARKYFIVFKYHPEWLIYIIYATFENEELINNKGENPDQ